ncbi:PREDICTED: uncharacterized protein LOC109223471 [Nicotiana attenuata]|uniref:Uncharacterized protein n=1 Tax=Nicotiana attenuata TaxID=49451 RepID=A0A1J6J410_NICAT|nr:PREDICTED: uncharacterized protein LOC109223471 [Nicotiana attenuata]OIT04607.1 hypothetical protein A4A49_31216 [Nicotiana attenuata]
MIITRNMDVQNENPNMVEENKILCSFFHGNIFILTNEEEEYCNYNYNNENNTSSYILGCEDYDERGNNEAERAIYWESQQALLQEILEQYSLIGSKLREGITRNIDRVKEGNVCECSNPKVEGCAKCLRRRVIHQLCEKGFNACLCTSKWKHTSKMPGGRHEYIEVIASTQGRKKKIPFLIELEFQDEFKMAKACKEYKKLISQLPEVFIGKSEHLNAIIRLMCDAAKKSTEQQRIHLGPWRKRNFMQMKWSANNSNTTAERRVVNTNIIDQQTLSKLRLNISPRQEVVLNDVRPGLEFAAATAVKVA